LSLDSPTTELLIGTLSAAGITINLGFLGVASAAFEVVTGRGQAEVVASRLRFPYRLIEHFSRERWVSTLAGISVVFILAGILDLTFVAWGWPDLSWSVIIEIIGLVSTAAVWVYLVGSSALMTPTEAATISSQIIQNAAGGTTSSNKTGRGKLRKGKKKGGTGEA
jgi:hypothetical protein